MKALTVWQPWASLIVHGYKADEFRSWAFPKRLVGERIVIHAGRPDPVKFIRHLIISDDRIVGSCGPMCDVAEIRRVLRRMLDHRESIPLGAGIGMVTLGEPLPVNEQYARRGWSIGGDGPWNVAWPMLRPAIWEEPVPCRGAQGLWEWPA